MIYKIGITLLFTVTFFSNTTFGFSESIIPQDSIGIETIDGKTFVLHKVSPKETLYAISKRYNSTISEIYVANPDSKDGLKIDVILKIPYKKIATLVKVSNEGTHTVQPKETMFSISRKYGISLADIKKWNNLENTELSIGQKLKIRQVKPSTKNHVTTTIKKSTQTSPVKAKNGQLIHIVTAHETLYSLSKKYNTTISKIRKLNKLTTFSLSEGQKLIIKKEGAVKEIKTTPEYQVVDNKRISNDSQYKDYDRSMEEIKKINTPETVKPRKTGFNKVIEKGFAEVIETQKGTKKWLALHRKAPIGSILRVKNEMNNLWVFVRVIGRLPETGINSKVLIKISKTAYDKLGAINDRFPVEISYVP